MRKADKKAKRLAPPPEHKKVVRAGSKKFVESGLSEIQERFCEEFIFGGVYRTHKEWAEWLNIASNTVGQWLRDPRIKQRLSEMREDRLEMMTQQAISKIPVVINSLANMVSLDYTYKIKVGKGEITKHDAEVMREVRGAGDQLVQLAGGLQNSISGSKAVDASDKAFNLNIAVNQMQGQTAEAKSASVNKLEEIEKELRDLKVLSPDEKLRD